MSKTFRKFRNRKNSDYYDDNEEDFFSSRSNYTKKRVDRNINNAIRSKNIDRLMKLSDHDDDDDDVRR